MGEAAARRPATPPLRAGAAVRAACGGGRARVSSVRRGQGGARAPETALSRVAIEVQTFPLTRLLRRGSSAADTGCSDRVLESSEGEAQRKRRGDGEEAVGCVLAAGHSATKAAKAPPVGTGNTRVVLLWTLKCHRVVTSGLQSAVTRERHQRRLYYA